MKTLIFIDPTVVFLPRMMKWKCWNTALAWTRKLNLNVRRTTLFLKFHLRIQHLLFEHRKRFFFTYFDRLSSLESLFYVLSGCWFQWHFRLKLKSQNTKEAAHLFLSCKEEIYSVQCKNTWQAIHLVLHFQNTSRLYFPLENVLM